MKQLLLILALGLVFVSLSSAVPIPACGPILVSGTYTITNDLTSNNAVCIDVQASDVSIDGQGFNINDTSGASTVSGIQVINQTDVNITNTNVSNYENGIYYENSNNSLIKNNNLFQNLNTGFYSLNSHNNVIDSNNETTSFAGFYIDTGSDNTILTNNIATNDGPMGGGFAIFSNDNTLSGNLAYNNPSGLGFFLHGNNIVVTSNNATKNGDVGFRMQNLNNITLSNNFVDNNSEGYHMDTVTNSSLTFNTALDSLIDGIQSSYVNNTIFDSNILNNNLGNGLYTNLNYLNNFTNNTAYNNSGSGLRVGFGFNNIVSNNSVTISDVGIYINGETSDNVSFNYVANTFSDGFILDSASYTNIVSNLQFNSTTGYRYLGTDIPEVTFNNTAFNNTLGFNVDTNYNNMSYNFINDSRQQAMYLHGGHNNISFNFIDGNNEVTSSGIFLFGRAIDQIEYNNVTRTRGGDPIGIDQTSQVNITHNFVYDNTNGIDDYAANGNLITYNNVTQIGYYGIYENGAGLTGGATIIFNNITFADLGASYGGIVGSAAGINVSYNNIDNSIHGLNVGSSGATYAFNNITNSIGGGTNGIGILTNPGANGNLFTNNRISGSSKYGMQVQNSNSRFNLITNNTFFNNTNADVRTDGADNTYTYNDVSNDPYTATGFYILGFRENITNNLIERIGNATTFEATCAFPNSNNVFNNVINNVTNSFYFVAEAGCTNDYNQIYDNVVTNSTYGLKMDGNSHETLQNNTLTNVTFPFYDALGSSNSLLNNTISIANYGAVLSGASTDDLESNFISNINYEGMRLNGANNNIIFNNLISFTGQTGIDLFGSGGNTISANTIHDISGDGILAFSTNTNNEIFRDNTLYNNQNGIQINGASAVIGNYSIFGNNILDNVLNGIFLNYSTNISIYNNALHTNHLTGLNVTDTNLSTSNNQFCGGNPIDLVVYGTNYNSTFQMNGDIFDSGGCSFQNYSNVSLLDTGYLAHNLQISYIQLPILGIPPYPPFKNQSIEVDTNSSTYFSYLKFNWIPSELPGYSQNGFKLYEYIFPTWTELNGTPNTVLHSLSLSGGISPGLFSILQSPSPTVFNSTLNYTNQTAYTTFTVSNDQITTSNTGNFITLYTAGTSTANPLVSTLLEIAGTLIAVYGLYYVAKQFI